MSEDRHHHYELQQDNSRRSAQVVLPILLNTIQPDSVVDVGCGVGAWLAVFLDLGVTDILGLDGDWVPGELLCIPIDRFQSIDLRSPPPTERRFDLAVSLEVGEHLPAEAAVGYVDYLTSFSNTVLFSAAIPYQGGAGHVNEQWPEYWADLFSTHSFGAIDCLRSKIWNNTDVCFWFRQNLLLFANDSAIDHSPALRAARDGTDSNSLRMVHPELWLSRAAKVERLRRRRSRPSLLDRLIRKLKKSLA